MLQVIAEGLAEILKPNRVAGGGGERPKKLLSIALSGVCILECLQRPADQARMVSVENPIAEPLSFVCIKVHFGFI